MWGEEGPRWAFGLMQHAAGLWFLPLGSSRFSYKATNFRSVWSQSLTAFNPEITNCQPLNEEGITKCFKSHLWLTIPTKKPFWNCLFLWSFVTPPYLMVVCVIITLGWKKSSWSCQVSWPVVNLVNDFNKWGMWTLSVPEIEVECYFNVTDRDVFFGDILKISWFKKLWFLCIFIPRVHFINYKLQLLSKMYLVGCSVSKYICGIISNWKSNLL